MSDIKNSKSTALFCSHILTAILPLVLVATYYYGGRVILMCAISLLAAAVARLAVYFVIGNPLDADDLFYAVSAICVTLSCPAAAPYFLPAAGSAVAVVVRTVCIKFTSRDWLCSAAMSVASLYLVAGSAMSSYTQPELRLALIGAGGQRVPSLMQSISAGMIPQVGPIELLLGRHGGPMGTTVLIVLIISATYLCLRRPRLVATVVPYMATLALFGVCNVRFGGSVGYSALLETLGGSGLFAVTFMAASCECMPSTVAGRAVSAVVMGAATMCLRYAGLCDSAAVFALLAVSLFSDSFDKVFVIISEKIRRVSDK